MVVKSKQGGEGDLTWRLRVLCKYRMETREGEVGNDHVWTRPTIGLTTIPNIPSPLPPGSKKHRTCGKRNSFPPERKYSYGGINREENVYFIHSIYTTTTKKKKKKKKI